MNVKTITKAVLILIGLGLFVYLVRQVGPGKIADHIRAIGWNYLSLVGLSALGHYARTWSWYYSLGRPHRVIRFWDMFSVRLAGDAVGTVAWGGPVFGEAAKTLIVKNSLALTNSIPSVVIDRIMYIFTGIIFTIAGFTLFFVRPGFSDSVKAYAVVSIIVLVLVTLLVRSIIRDRSFLVGLVDLGKRTKLGRHYLASQQEKLQQIEDNIRSFYIKSKGSFFLVLALNLAAHFLRIGEIYLILKFLDVNVTFLTAYLIEMLTKLVNISSYLIPGTLGTFEGGNMLILRYFKLGASLGLTLALIRRSIVLLWAGVGFIILLLYEFNILRINETADERG